jgi:hypothetical protein
MSVKLLLLKSGEDVVAEVQEMVVEEKVVGYYLKYPCSVKLITEVDNSEGISKMPSRIQLLPWMPLSKNKIIPVVSDWVVTMTEPVDQLVKMFEDGVQKYETNKGSNSDE